MTFWSGIPGSQEILSLRFSGDPIFLDLIIRGSLDSITRFQFVDLKMENFDQIREPIFLNLY